MRGYQTTELNAASAPQTELNSATPAAAAAQSGQATSGCQTTPISTNSPVCTPVQTTGPTSAASAALPAALPPTPQSATAPAPTPASAPAPGLFQALRHESWCEVRISFWGPGAFEAALTAAGALQSDARWFDLWRLIGFGGVGPIEHTSAPFRGRVQGRACFDLSFYACLGAAYPAEWFDTARWDLPRPGRHETFNTSKEIACEPKSHC